MTDSPSTPTEPFAVPAGRRAHGRLRVPSSKSLTHRYFNLALLSGAPMVVERPLFAEDTRLFLAALGRCGFRVEEGEDEVRLTPEERPAGEVEIFCGNAGTMLRFLVATLTVVPGRWRLDGVPRLRERPVGPLVDALRSLGANLEYLAAEGYVPLRIEGGSLRGGTTSLDAGESSQYLSAILMAALRAPEPVVVEVPSLTSRPYVDVTLAAATAFDGHIERVGPRAYRVRPSALRGGRLRVEGDYSAACYPAAAAALTGGDVSLDGLSPDSRQGDREFMDLLAEMGAEISWKGEVLRIRGGDLRGIKADLSGMPDQVPTLAALAPFALGETLIHNVAHLRIKESDRLEAMATELEKLGADVREGRDSLWIPGLWSEAEPSSEPVHVDPRGDHRIAMSLALVGLRRPGVVVDHPEVVAKSYPGFWRDLVKIL
ncbi:MAG: 3-phosphoshikimate 1-carboxyvinyltransferase [Acidobacteriota bacterium]|jgi:3-phosphoshikimate 1-carboxyvinyltransferase|nr:3-phosphoshikimate 1-carboxyvinyltransferase [Acidobacteriota bacterium]